LAANQGSSYAQNYLGIMYEEGKGVTQDYNQAISWYQKAADQGNSDARTNLKDLELSEDKTKEVVKLANETVEKKKENQKPENEKALETQSRDVENAIEIEFWNSIKDSNDSEEYQIYLDEFPKGKFAKLAKYRIEKLASTSIPAGTVSIPELDFGNYYALVIGNDNYRYLPKLQNAVNDANDVASLLRSKYQFEVDVLTNATRAEIVSSLSRLSKKLSKEDNLLIYYAGHGDIYMDEGFWLPIDAVNDDQVHWVANHTIMRSVKAMQAKHVMVVADSCFSGTLTRGIKRIDQSPDYIKKILNKKARTALTSGGYEPVSDGGGDNNSIFAESFIRALQDNKGVIDGNQLFNIIRKNVLLNSIGQTPEYGDIKQAGHDGGDFLFVRRWPALKSLLLITMKKIDVWKNYSRTMYEKTTQEP